MQNAEQPSLGSLSAHLTETVQRLRRRYRGPLAGLLRPLWTGVRAVRLRPLTRERKIERDREVLWLDKEYCGRYYKPARKATLAACTMYFLHELLHVAQGIAEKTAIHRLRDTGAEDTLMLVDLWADHGAAVLAAASRPDWGLLSLKDQSGRGLRRFPVGPSHTPGARRRKCRRLSALRMDVAARRAGLLRDVNGEGGPIWLEFAPSGGPLLLLQGGAMPCVRLMTELSAGEAQLLDSAADPIQGVTLQELDRLCLALLVRGTAPKGR